jgi:hypothetical protein
MLGPRYPRELEASIGLLDGTIVRIRRIRPDDEVRLIEFSSAGRNQF